MKVTNFDPEHAYRVHRGITLGSRAAANGIVVSDGATEVVPAAKVIFNGATVTDLGDNVASIDLDTGVRTLLNNSGGPVALGDVVVTDPTEDEAFTSTTTAQVTNREVGVVQASIAAGERGPVLFSGYTSALRVNAAVTRGHFAETSTDALVAGANADRQDGSFAVFLTGADPADTSYSLSDYIVDSATTVLDAAGTALTVTMPATRPDGLFMLLVLWIDGTSSGVTATGWTRIGATDGFYYYTRTGSSEPATYSVMWTGSSKAVAAVVVLDVVDTAAPVADFDYDAAGTAAEVTGLASDYYLLVAGVDRAEATPAGWTALATDSTADDSINGTLVAQVISGTGGTSPFPGITGPGGPPIDVNEPNGTVSSMPGGTVWANPTNANDGNGATFASVGSDGEAGLIADLGAPFTISSMYVFGGDWDDNIPDETAWSSNGSSWTVINSYPPGAEWVANAVDEHTYTLASPVTARYWRIRWPNLGSGGTVKTWQLIGQAEVGNDALLALDITATPLVVVPVPSALLFGVPDLGGGGTVAAGDVTVTDAGDYFSGTDVEAVLQELGADVANAELNIEGGQDVVKAHGTLGATEACDPTDGNVHTGTLDQDCTITLAAPTGSGGATLQWWVTQDGTGGWDVTFAATGGSVTDDGTITPDTTAGVTVRYILERVPGTTNDWIRNIVGGSGAAAIEILDEGVSLTATPTSIDFVGAGVTATAVGDAVTVTITGGATASDTGIWRPLMDGAGNVITDGATGEAVMAFS